MLDKEAKLLAEILDKIFQELPKGDVIYDLSQSIVTQEWGIAEKEIFQNYTKLGKEDGLDGQRHWLWRAVCKRLSIGMKQADGMYFRYAKKLARQTRFEELEAKYGS